MSRMRGSLAAAAIESGMLWSAKWQWKIQLPGRSGDQVIDIAAQGGSNCVTTICPGAGCPN